MWMQYSSVHAHTHFKSPFTLSGSKKACCMLVSYPRAPRNAREKFPPKFPGATRRDCTRNRVKSPNIFPRYAPRGTLPKWCKNAQSFPSLRAGRLTTRFSHPYYVSTALCFHLATLRTRGAVSIYRRAALETSALYPTSPKLQVEDHKTFASDEKCSVCVALALCV
jgi:hypothetical protein